MTPPFFSRHLLKLLLSLALLTGVLVYKDYGVGWDEDFSVITGHTNYEYVFGNDTSLQDFILRDYGAAFELPADMVIQAFGYDDMRHIYLVRRILSYLVFVMGCCCVFLLTDLLFNDKLAAAGAFLMLWLHPHLFAHAFFNSKDIPFLSFLALTLYLLIAATTKRKWWLFCFAGVAAGLLTGTRIPGVIYVALGSGWIISEALIMREFRRGLLCATIFIVFSALTMFISWPNLWAAPVGNFLNAFSNMSKFSWDFSVLFGGEYFEASRLPWYYIPALFVISMPSLFLVVGICGIILPFWSAIATWQLGPRVRAGFFFILCFVLPVVTILVLQSVVYDGWRHLFFIYVPFVLLCGGVLHKLSSTNKRAAAITIAVLVLPVACFFVYAHPFQHVFYNSLTKRTGEDLKQDYEMDYWGVGYKQGLEFLLANDSSAIIPVAAENVPMELNIKLLPPGQSKRFKMVPITEARYFLTNYRWHRHEYDDKPVKLELIKVFKVCGNSVQGVYRVAGN